MKGQQTNCLFVFPRQNIETKQGIVGGRESEAMKMKKNVDEKSKWILLFFRQFNIVAN